MSSGTSAWNRGRFAFTSETTASVDASGRLVTGMYTARRPLTSAYAVGTSVLSATDPTSRMNTVGPGPVRIGSDSSSLMLATTEFTGVISVVSPTFTLPDGMITFPEATARTTSSGDMP